MEKQSRLPRNVCSGLLFTARAATEARACFPFDGSAWIRAARQASPCNRRKPFVPQDKQASALPDGGVDTIVPAAARRWPCTIWECGGLPPPRDVRRGKVAEGEACLAMRCSPAARCADTTRRNWQAARRRWHRPRRSRQAARQASPCNRRKQASALPEGGAAIASWLLAVYFSAGLIGGPCWRGNARSGCARPAAT